MSVCAICQKKREDLILMAIAEKAVTICSDCKQEFYPNTKVVPFGGLTDADQRNEQA